MLHARFYPLLRSQTAEIALTISRYEKQDLELARRSDCFLGAVCVSGEALDMGVGRDSGRRNRARC